jgi:hypothetical protein
MSSPSRKNIYLSEKRKPCFNTPVPRSPKRRIAIVTTRGAGCDGRGWLRGDRDQRVRSSRVVLIPRRWDQVLSMMIDKATGASKPGTPGRARYKPSNHRAGNAGLFRRTCSDYLLVCCLPLFCTQGCGCGVHPAFPAPSSSRGTRRCTTRVDFHRGNVVCRPYPCHAPRRKYLLLRTPKNGHAR